MSDRRAAPGPTVLAAVAILSAAALGYEILLTRLLAITQWHHLAFMVISIALLGFGASGTFLLVLGDRIRLSAATFLAIAALGFAVAAPVCFGLAERISFNVLELPWSLRPFGRLLAIEVLLAIPFFLAALGIGRTLVVHGNWLSRVYAADLLGAGGGAMTAVALLYWLPPERILDGLAAAGALAAGLAAVNAARSSRRRLHSLVGLVLAAALVGPGWVKLRISPFKPLPQALQVSGAMATATRFGPLGLVNAVENETVPFRLAPGLSLLASAPVPEQVALFVDGNGPIAILHHGAGDAPPAYLDDLTSALPYHLLDRPRVLVLGSGGGTPVLQALAAGAPSVVAVESQPHVASLTRDRYRAFSGGVYENEKVRLHVGDPRAFVESTVGAGFDLIKISALGASRAGLDALREERLLTVESIHAILLRLDPRGILAITGWAQLPPRGGPRLFATVLDALERAGIGPASERLAWVRSWNTNTLILSRSALSEVQVEATRSFARDRAFDLVHLPGMEVREANRFNVLQQPWFHEAAAGLLGPGRDRFIRDYKFDIRPATDDRPYLWNFFRWAHAPEILALSREGGIGLLAIGYLALPVTLVQAVILSAVLILLPLAVRRRRNPRGGAQRGATLMAFSGFGLAFLIMEIAFISRFTVILSHPLHALVVVLAAFLAFAGAGSWLAGRRGPGRGSVALPVSGIVLISVLYGLAQSDLTAWLVGASPWIKILACVSLVAPLATLMGMPFPVTLARLRRLDPAMVPWAWGTNGCASVIGVVLATLLAVHFGQNFAIGCAAALYVLAEFAAARMERGSGTREAERSGRIVG